MGNDIMMIMNCFCGMVDLRTVGSRISRRDYRQIIRKPHHRDFQTYRGGDRSRIEETAIRSATTTSRRHRDNDVQKMNINQD